MIYLLLIPLISYFFIFQLYRKPHFYIVLSSLTSLFCLGALAGTLISPGLMGVEVQGRAILIFGLGFGLSAYIFFKLLMMFEEGQSWLKGIADGD